MRTWQYIKASYSTENYLFIIEPGYDGKYLININKWDSKKGFEHFGGSICNSFEEAKVKVEELAKKLEE